MTHSLTAAQEGRITLPSVKVTLEGKTYKTNPVDVNILKPGKTDKLDLSIELSESTCYVGQPIEVTISFYINPAIK